MTTKMEIPQLPFKTLSTPKANAAATQEEREDNVLGNQLQEDKEPPNELGSALAPHINSLHHSALNSSLYDDLHAALRPD